ncbi:MAG: PAS domain S-box protein [Anaerolineae bacterium]|nr:PAS domain S-box protein [Anaerolineae bacterium]
MVHRDLKILCVDKSEQTLSQLRPLLDNIKVWQVQMDYAYDYETAWAKLSAINYDLCFFSYALERQDGLKFLQRLSEQKPDIYPVLLIDSTAQEMNGDFWEIGEVDFLVKEQMDVALLKRVIRYAIRYKEMIEQQHAQAASKPEPADDDDDGDGDDLHQVESDQSTDAQNQLFFNLDVYAIEILDARGNITDCNETYQRMIGYSRREIIGRHTTAFATENSKKLFAKKFMILKKQGYAEGELELIRKDGSKIIVWRRYRAVRHADGSLSQIVSYNRNITERLKAVRQISLLARALEQSPVAMMITDRKGVINYVNFRFTELTEYSYEDVVGKNMRSMETEWQSQDELENMWSTLNSGEEWRGEWYNLTKSGEVYWELITAIPMFNPKGQVTNFIFVKENFTAQKDLETDTLQTQRRMGALMTEQIDDLMSSNETLRFEVSERKRAEQELRQSQARLRAQFHGIPVPTYSWEIVGDTYILIDYNEAANQDSHGKIADMVGLTAQKIFEDRPDVLKDFDVCAREKMVVKREGPYQLVTTGEDKYFVTTYNFVPPNFIVVHIENITRYKKLEADLAYYRDQIATTADDTSALDQLKDSLNYEIAKREQIEQQAQENEERLKLIASSIDDRLREHYRTIPIPTYTWQMIGGEFVLVDFNDAAAQAMGRIVDFFGKTAAEVFTDRPQVLADFQHCYETKAEVVREAPYQLVTSGEIRFFVTTYNYLPPNLIIVHIQDITDQKAMENQLTESQSLVETEKQKREVMEAELAALKLEAEQLRDEVEAHQKAGESARQSKARLKSQYKGIPVPTYAWQRTGNDFVMVDYNDAAEKANHGRIADLMGRPASEVFKDRPQVLADFHRCYAEKTTVKREATYKLISRDETKFFITTYNYIPPNLVQVFIQDITEYKQPES